MEKKDILASEHNKFSHKGLLNYNNIKLCMDSLEAGYDAAVVKMDKDVEATYEKFLIDHNFNHDQEKLLAQLYYLIAKTIAGKHG